jgi:hypothetical protein
MEQAVCPKNPEHKLFITTAHVMQEWVVTPTGEFVRESVRGVVEVTHAPSFNNCWTCAECGTEAKIVDDSAEEEMWFTNFYECEDCSVHWEDVWNGQPDDECPTCGKFISPYDSKDSESPEK